MTSLLRGDPSRFTIGQILAAAESGARASEAFLARLAEDSRAGVESARRALCRREEEARTSRSMLVLERAHWERGVTRVAGVDEVGMGPLAGPVVAAAVILAPGGPIPAARDSKVLTPDRRERLAEEIRMVAVAFGIGSCSVEEIAATDVHAAGLEAMRRAVSGLRPTPEHVLVDARTIPALSCTQEAHVQGDARSVSIAAASILAKVERDAVMRGLAEEHPGYGFEHHAGYATAKHLEALRRLGPCPAHRTSWASLPEHAGDLGDAFYALRDGLRAVTDLDGLAAWMGLVAARASELPPDEVRRLEALVRKRKRLLCADARGAPPMADLPWSP